MLKPSHVLCLAFSLICLTACARVDSTTQTDPDRHSMIKTLDLKAGMSPSDASISKNFIYYTDEHSMPMAQFGYAATLYRYDLASEKTQKMLDLKFEHYGVVRELFAGEDHIFFTGDIMSSGETILWEYRISTPSLEPIYRYSHPIALAYEHPYLVWYEIDEESLEDKPLYPKEIPGIMKCYNVQNKELYALSPGHRILSPYQRVNILKGVVTFFTRENDRCFVHTYDLKTDRILWSKEIGAIGSRAVSNERFTVYSANSVFGDLKIRIIDREDPSYSIPEIDAYLNYALQGDLLHIFYSDKIILFDLKTAESKPIFQTEGLLGYGIGESGGYVLELFDHHSEKKHQLVYKHDP